MPRSKTQILSYFDDHAVWMTLSNLQTKASNTEGRSQISIIIFRGVQWAHNLLWCFRHTVLSGWQEHMRTAVKADALQNLHSRCSSSSTGSLSSISAIPCFWRSDCEIRSSSESDLMWSRSCVTIFASQFALTYSGPFFTRYSPIFLKRLSTLKTEWRYGSFEFVGEW